VLEELAVDHQEEHNATKILLEDFYVDDVLTGSKSEDELRRNRDELIQLMSCANLQFGKWVSNTSFIQTDDTDAQLSPVKVLGLYWHPREDIVTYKIGPDCTKRQILKDGDRESLETKDGERESFETKDGDRESLETKDGDPESLETKERIRNRFAALRGVRLESTAITVEVPEQPLSGDSAEEIGSDDSRHLRQPRYHRRAELIEERSSVADVKH